MDEKKPIDKKRDSGGWVNVGTEEDGAISELINIGGRLIVIKERAIYESKFADKVDPNRTNIGLPGMIPQLLIDKGAKSELVSRVFLTAKSLFRSNHFDSKFDTSKSILLSLELVQELLILEKEINEFLALERAASEEYEKNKTKPNSYTIPTLTNLDTRCKTIFQKADHAEQILMEIITNFYLNEGLTKQSHFPMFYQVLLRKYGEEAPFCKFLNKTLRIMNVIRQLRNGLDHRLPTVTVKNFDLQPDSVIISPSIELNHKEVRLERISLSSFLPDMFESIVTISEVTFAYLAGMNVKSFGNMTPIVKEVPEEKRKYKFVRYALWSPMGPDGFFEQ